MLGVSIELAQSGLRSTDTDLRPWGWPQGICCSPSSGKIPQSKHLGQPWSPGCFARLCGHPTRVFVATLCICYLGVKTTCLARIHSLPLSLATPSVEGPGPFRKRGKEVSDGRGPKACCRLLGLLVEAALRSTGTQFA